jgi:tRNA threonylcarbamoyladenosine biosynthesis protein TsaE
VTAAATLVIELPDEAATSDLAADLARAARRGDVIGLSGPLGAGKTSFARAFIRSRLGVAEVPSPTFALVEVYESATDAAIWHFDLYRLEKPDDVYELGFEDALAGGIVLIEWPERLGALMLREHLMLRLVQGASDTARHAELDPSPAWAARIARIAGLRHD